MQDSVTRHPDDNEEIGVLVGQTHVHLHASWLYQRHNQPDTGHCSHASLSTGAEATSGAGSLVGW